MKSIKTLRTIVIAIISALAFRYFWVYLIWGGNLDDVKKTFFNKILVFLLTLISEHGPTLLLVSFIGLILAYVLRSWKRED